MYSKMGKTQIKMMLQNRQLPIIERYLYDTITYDDAKHIYRFMKMTS